MSPKEQKITPGCSAIASALSMIDGIIESVSDRSPTGHGEVLDLGVKAGLIEKSGSWFSHDSTRIGQGRENAKQFLTDNPEMFAKIETAIRGRTSEVAEALMTGGAEEE